MARFLEIKKVFDVVLSRLCEGSSTVSFMTRLSHRNALNHILFSRKSALKELSVDVRLDLTTCRISTFGSWAGGSFLGKIPDVLNKLRIEMNLERYCGSVTTYETHFLCVAVMKELVQLALMKFAGRGAECKDWDTGSPQWGVRPCTESVCSCRIGVEVTTKGYNRD